jgi:hypothetical protein
MLPSPWHIASALPEKATIRSFHESQGVHLMKVPNRRLIRVIGAGTWGVALLLAGCATPGPGAGGNAAGGGSSGGVTASQITAANVPRVGFLTDYAKLAPMPGGDGMLCWRASNINWKMYDKVMFERIQVYIKPGSQQPVDPSDLKAMIDYFHQALVTATKREAQVVEKPGPGVLRVQLALTALIPTDVTKSLTGTAIPYGFVAEMGSGAASGRPAGSTPYMGQTGLEARFRDGATGNVVGECADNEIGLKYAADVNAGVAGAAENWINGYLDSFSSWTYAKLAFDKWSAAFAQRFAALRK